eukprot:COSAG04_NODE_2434_length_4134_cov_1.690706_1_plen_92_part_00
MAPNPCERGGGGEVSPQAAAIPLAGAPCSLRGAPACCARSPVIAERSQRGDRRTSRASSSDRQFAHPVLGLLKGPFPEPATGQRTLPQGCK